MHWVKNGHWESTWKGEVSQPSLLHPHWCTCFGKKEKLHVDGKILLLEIRRQKFSSRGLGGRRQQCALAPKYFFFPSKNLTRGATLASAQTTSWLTGSRGDLKVLKYLFNHRRSWQHPSILFKHATQHRVVCGFVLFLTMIHSCVTLSLQKDCHQTRTKFGCQKQVWISI